MQIQISVIQVAVETKSTTKGSYQMATVTYKDLGNGKVNEKKVMSFKDKEVFTKVSQAKNGEVLYVTMEKEDGYWNWKKVDAAPPGTSAQTPASNAVPAPTAGKTSTYETAEERAKKQVYIVKQSSLSLAATLLSIGAKQPPSVDAVIELAEKFKNYVFDTAPKVNHSLIDMPNDLPELDDMPQ